MLIFNFHFLDHYFDLFPVIWFQSLSYRRHWLSTLTPVVINAREAMADYWPTDNRRLTIGRLSANSD